MNSNVSSFSDAAHVVHPMAGLGLNLGLNDVKSLADTIHKAYETGQDIGDLNMLRGYNQSQMLNNSIAMGAIDGLWTLFHNQLPPLQWIRGTGMQIVDRLPLLKSAVMRYAMSQ